MKCETSPVCGGHYDPHKNRFGDFGRMKPGLNGPMKECKVELEEC